MHTQYLTTNCTRDVRMAVLCILQAIVPRGTGCLTMFKWNDYTTLSSERLSKGHYMRYERQLQLSACCDTKAATLLCTFVSLIFEGQQDSQLTNFSVPLGLRENQTGFHPIPNCTTRLLTIHISRVKPAPLHPALPLLSPSSPLEP